MRRAAVALLFLLITAPAFAGKPLNIAQLEEFLKTDHDKPDADFAYLIADQQLTERLNAQREAQLAATLPGEKSRQALHALADESQFEPPPAEEIPAKAVPDVAEKKRIMGAVVAYVRDTIPQLPNFLATRETTRYEDTPLMQLSYAPFIPYQPIHFIGSTVATISYREGRDVATPVALRGKKPEPEPPGLTTWGVFGPILGTVLVDAARSSLAWERWEQGKNGAIAVFRFAVPEAKSQYEVNYCCVADPGSTRPNGVPFRKKPGYHGELEVDPATGAVMRLIIEAELKPSDPVSDAAILVEYGPVEIGGKSYICPVRSLSRSHEQEVQVDVLYHIPVPRQIQPVELSLNEALFRDYHVFRSEARVITGEPSDP